MASCSLSTLTGAALAAQILNSPSASAATNARQREAAPLRHRAVLRLAGPIQPLCPFTEALTRPCGQPRAHLAQPLAVPGDLGSYLRGRRAAQHVARVQRAAQRQHVVHVLLDRAAELLELRQWQPGQVDLPGDCRLHGVCDGFVSVTERNALAHEVI